jgi:hypothetical protein
VIRFGALLLLAMMAACRGPSPRDDLDRAADAARQQRIGRIGGSRPPARPGTETRVAG